MGDYSRRCNIDNARTRTAVYLLLAIAIASTIAVAVQAGSAKPANFDVIQYEDRFAGIRMDVPKDATIGYLTDADLNLTSTTAEYYLAQLALIPTVVANKTDQKMVMANVHTPQPPEFYRSRGLELVKDYNNGVMLLRRVSR